MSKENKSTGDLEATVCGCGNPSKYMVLSAVLVETWACNKWQRCPTYEDLRGKVRDLEIEAKAYKHHLEKIVNVNGMDYEYKAWAKHALNAYEAKK